MVLRFVRKIINRISKRRQKKVMSPPKPATETITTTTTTTAATTHAWISTTFTSVSSAVTTIGQIGNATSDVLMRTAESNMKDDDELMSLTEIMGLVVGAVILISMIVLVCFVYRTKCRTQVKRRQPLSTNERRSAAISMDLMELNDYDQRIRQNAGVRLPPTINSPLYGRENDYSDIKLTINTKPSSSQNGTALKLENGGKADTEYYNVVLSENEGRHGEEDTDSYINANEVLRHKLEAFKEIPTETAAAKEKRDEALRYDKLARAIQDTDETYDNFDDVDSVDLSTPPTPCYDSSYVNLSTGYINEWEPSEKGYVNTEFREQCMPLIERSLDNDKCPYKKDKTAKNKQQTNDKDKSNVQNKKEKSNKDHACRVPQNGDQEMLYGDDQQYLPMDSKNTRDISYMPMECGLNEEDATVDNVYIYMEKNDPAGDYMNCNAVNTVYENT